MNGINLNSVITGHGPFLVRLADGAKVTFDLDDRIGTIDARPWQLVALVEHLVSWAAAAPSVQHVAVSTHCQLHGVSLRVRHDGARRAEAPAPACPAAASFDGDGRTANVAFDTFHVRSAATPPPEDRAPPCAPFRHLEALDLVADAVYLADVQTGRFIDANTAAIRLLGYPREELLTKVPADLKPGALRGTLAQWQEQVALMRSTPQLAIQTVHLRADGTQVPVDILVQIAQVGGREVVAGVARDLTQRGGAIGLMDENRPSIEKVASWMAHQLNNPLATAMQNIEWCLQRGDLEPEVVKALREATTGLLQLEAVIGRLTPELAERAQDDVEALAETGARILIVDDDALVATALTRLLRGHSVEMVESAREAIAFAQKASFDVVFCDLMMPEMSGMDLHEHWMKCRPELAARMVFITGGAFQEPTRSFVTSHPERCLKKPLRRARLEAVIRRVRAQAPRAAVA